MNPPRMNSRRWFWTMIVVLCGWMLLGVRGTPTDLQKSAGIARRVDGVVANIASILLTPLKWTARSAQLAVSGTLLSRHGNIDEAYVRQLEQDNKQLKNLVYLLHGQNAEYNNLIKQSNNIKANFPTITAAMVLPATITSVSPAGSGSDICDIDKGYLDGVDRNLIVLSDLAPVGRIIYVGPKNSKVLLITDRDRRIRINATIDRETPDGFTPIVDRCQVYGSNDGMLHCDDVDAVHSLAPQVNDILRVKDSEWHQIPGAVIGTITRVSRKESSHLRYDLLIAPRVNINRTDRVVVLLVK